MTSKTIEKLKTALYPYVSRGDRTNAAQAAIEALDIIILPEDAEPEIGDVIIDDVGEPHIVKDTFNNMAIWETDECVEQAPFIYCRTIQRNGKPVIQEGK